MSSPNIRGSPSNRTPIDKFLTPAAFVNKVAQRALLSENGPSAVCPLLLATELLRACSVSQKAQLVRSLGFENQILIGSDDSGVSEPVFDFTTLARQLESLISATREDNPRTLTLSRCALGDETDLLGGSKASHEKRNFDPSSPHSEAFVRPNTDFICPDPATYMEQVAKHVAGNSYSLGVEMGANEGWRSPLAPQLEKFPLGEEPRSMFPLEAHEKGSKRLMTELALQDWIIRTALTGYGSDWHSIRHTEKLHKPLGLKFSVEELNAKSLLRNANKLNSQTLVPKAKNEPKRRGQNLKNLKADTTIDKANLNGTVDTVRTSAFLSNFGVAVQRMVGDPTSSSEASPVDGLRGCESWPDQAPNWMVVFDKTVKPIQFNAEGGGQSSIPVAAQSLTVARATEGVCFSKEVQIASDSDMNSSSTSRTASLVLLPFGPAGLKYHGRRQQTESPKEQDTVNGDRHGAPSDSEPQFQVFFLMPNGAGTLQELLECDLVERIVRDGAEISLSSYLKGDTMSPKTKPEFCELVLPRGSTSGSCTNLLELNNEILAGASDAKTDTVTVPSENPVLMSHFARLDLNLTRFRHPHPSLESERPRKKCLIEDLDSDAIPTESSRIVLDRPFLAGLCCRKTKTLLFLGTVGADYKAGGKISKDFRTPLSRKAWAKLEDEENSARHEEFVNSNSHTHGVELRGARNRGTSGSTAHQCVRLPTWETNYLRERWHLPKSTTQFWLDLEEIDLIRKAQHEKWNFKIPERESSEVTGAASGDSDPLLNSTLGVDERQIEKPIEEKRTKGKKGMKKPKKAVPAKNRKRQNEILVSVSLTVGTSSASTQSKSKKSTADEHKDKIDKKREESSDTPRPSKRLRMKKCGISLASVLELSRTETKIQATESDFEQISDVDEAVDSEEEREIQIGNSPRGRHAKKVAHCTPADLRLGPRTASYSNHMRNVTWKLAKILQARVVQYIGHKWNIAEVGGIPRAAFDATEHARTKRVIDQYFACSESKNLCFTILQYVTDLCRTMSQVVLRAGTPDEISYGYCYPYGPEGNEFFKSAIFPIPDEEQLKLVSFDKRAGRSGRKSRFSDGEVKLRNQAIKSLKSGVQGVIYLSTYLFSKCKLKKYMESDANGPEQRLGTEEVGDTFWGTLLHEGTHVVRNTEDLVYTAEGTRKLLQYQTDGDASSLQFSVLFELTLGANSELQFSESEAQIFGSYMTLELASERVQFNGEKVVYGAEPLEKDDLVDVSMLSLENANHDTQDFELSQRLPGLSFAQGQVSRITGTSEVMIKFSLPNGKQSQPISVDVQQCETYFHENESLTVREATMAELAITGLEKGFLFAVQQRGYEVSRFCEQNEHEFKCCMTNSMKNLVLRYMSNSNRTHQRAFEFRAVDNAYVHTFDNADSWGYFCCDLAKPDDVRHFIQGGGDVLTLDVQRTQNTEMQINNMHLQTTLLSQYAAKYFESVCSLLEGVVHYGSPSVQAENFKVFKMYCQTSKRHSKHDLLSTHRILVLRVFQKARSLAIQFSAAQGGSSTSVADLTFPRLVAGRPAGCFGNKQAEWQTLIEDVLEFFLRAAVRQEAPNAQPDDDATRYTEKKIFNDPKSVPPLAASRLVFFAIATHLPNPEDMSESIKTVLLGEQENESKAVEDNRNVMRRYRKMALEAERWGMEAENTQGEVSSQDTDVEMGDLSVFREEHKVKRRGKTKASLIPKSVTKNFKKSLVEHSKKGLEVLMCL